LQSVADLKEIDEIKNTLTFTNGLHAKHFLPQHTTGAVLSIGTLGSVKRERYLSNAFYLQKLKGLKNKN